MGEKTKMTIRKYETKIGRGMDRVVGWVMQMPEPEVLRQTEEEEEGMGRGVGQKRTEKIAHWLEFNLSIGKV